jgi:hypothetical protein
MRIITVLSFQEYEEMGAVISEDISSATHIIGVKAPDPEELIEDKASFMSFC